MRNYTVFVFEEVFFISCADNTEEMIKAAILDYTIYNHWANQTLTGWLRSLDSTLLYKESKSSFASIAHTLQHMINAQNFWYAVISNAGIDDHDEQLQPGTVDEIMGALLKGSQQIVDVVNMLTEDGLAAKVSSPAITKSRYEFILHTINHNSYHRGQIITICRVLGINHNIPNTDYDTYLWAGNSK
ncbi:DinB family protein [Panacibacter sp. DH6]|uniref:DinB family protein n=1 Tax=Panacibacter microcysteis TaxID=2793269 RepID=A0A931E9A1_9BACT|nr:DinB family protein [Panacibacter microcysteis]MBG9377513.1 DinB family protein [Panacibacter microcysteis]